MPRVKHRPAPQQRANTLNSAHLLLSLESLPCPPPLHSSTRLLTSAATARLEGYRRALLDCCTPTRLLYPDTKERRLLEAEKGRAFEKLEGELRLLGVARGGSKGVRLKERMLLLLSAGEQRPERKERARVE